MIAINWNPENLTLRQYFWGQHVITLLDQYKIKGSEKIIVFYTGKGITATKLIKSQLKEGFVTEIDLIPNLASQETWEEKVLSQSNEYDIAYGFIRPALLDLKTVVAWFDRCYELLKPTGYLLVTLPSASASPIETFKQVVASGEFPSLSGEEMTFDTAYNEGFYEKLTQSSFELCGCHDLNIDIVLPTISVYRAYLLQLSFLYQHVCPTSLQEKVIDRQVELFDEYCQNNFGGEYRYEYRTHIIKAAK